MNEVHNEKMFGIQIKLAPATATTANATCTTEPALIEDSLLLPAVPAVDDRLLLAVVVVVVAVVVVLLLAVLPAAVVAVTPPAPVDVAAVETALLAVLVALFDVLGDSVGHTGAGAT
jgi:hypothetical protein